jgi:hypothetical protein
MGAHGPLVVIVVVTGLGTHCLLFAYAEIYRLVTRRRMESEPATDGPALGQTGIVSATPAAGVTTTAADAVGKEAEAKKGLSHQQVSANHVVCVCVCVCLCARA